MMRDVFAWSVRVGGVWGVAIRVHWLLPVVAIGLILRAAYTKDVIPGTWIDVSALMGLLFFSVLLHELGHCVAARLVDGDAQEILLWPLGGLAFVEVPPTPRANFLTAAAGPLTNLMLFLIFGALLGLVTDPNVRPPFNPLWWPCRYDAEGTVHLMTWSGQAYETTSMTAILLARLFWVNWILFLFNIVLVGFPMDSGRMFQCLLWPRLGYVEATRVACYTGFLFAAFLFIGSILWNDVLIFGLALFIALTCRQQLYILETGGEESLFGYDFSQGYTSLERDAPLRRRRQSFLQRWLQRRAARRLQRDQERREAEDRRMDELLEKVQTQGLHALSEEERRFLTRVSARYKKQ